MDKREIEFRAWDKVGKQGMLGWVKMIEIGIELFFKDSFGFELMQFTGLLDKNGKEIYEGDIANITYTCMRFSHWMKVTDRGVMEWIEKSAQFSFKVNNSILSEEMEYLEVEIIGNIYENENLLEDK